MTRVGLSAPTFDFSGEFTLQIVDFVVTIARNIPRRVGADHKLATGKLHIHRCQALVEDRDCRLQGYVGQGRRQRSLSRQTAT
jgi:hypothetical protein